MQTEALKWVSFFFGGGGYPFFGGFKGHLKKQQHPPVVGRSPKRRTTPELHLKVIHRLWPSISEWFRRKLKVRKKECAGGAEAFGFRHRKAPSKQKTEKNNFFGLAVNLYKPTYTYVYVRVCCFLECSPSNLEFVHVKPSHHCFGLCVPTL